MVFNVFAIALLVLLLSYFILYWAMKLPEEIIILILFVLVIKFLVAGKCLQNKKYSHLMYGLSLITQLIAVIYSFFRFERGDTSFLLILIAATTIMAIGGFAPNKDEKFSFQAEEQKK